MARTAYRHVAVLIESSTSWGQGLIEGIARFADEHDRWLLFVEPRGEYEQLQVPAHWQGDGVIARVTSETLARQIMATRLPAVNVSWYRYGEGGIPRCTSDEELSGRLAADHLLVRGLRNFAYCGAENRPNYVDRLAMSFARALDDAGHTCQQFNGIENPRPWQERLSELGRWLERLPKPLGVLAFDSVTARQLASACLKVGLRVPEDVALLGGEYDRLSSEISWPKLSGIDQSAERVGYEAARLLGQLIDGELAPSAPVLVPPAGVVIRQSTDLVAVEDEDLSAALRYMRAHAHEPIEVGDVLAAAPMSRRVLEQKFKQLLGRTPAAELWRIRIEQAKCLLRDSSLPIPRVAEQCSFGNAQVFSRVFRRETGTTPSEYRKRMRPR